MKAGDFEAEVQHHVAAIKEITYYLPEEESFTMYIMVNGKEYKLEVESARVW